MTIQDLYRHHMEEYDHMEVYKSNRISCRGFNSYECTLTDNYDEDTYVRFSEIMSEARYNECFQMRKKYPYDFLQLYGDHNAKILCVLV